MASVALKELNIETTLLQKNTEALATTSAKAAAAGGVGGIGKAAEDIKAARPAIDALKKDLVSLSTETGESFNTIITIVRTSLQSNVNAAKTSVRSLTDELNNLKKSATLGRDVGGLFGAVGGPLSSGQLAEVNTRIQTVGTSLDAMKGQLNTAQAAYKNFQTTSTTALKELNQEQKGATEGTKSFGLNLRSLNDIARLVFGVTLLSLAAQALRSLVNWFKEISGQALVFSQAMFQLEVGARALRRAGIDITSSDILENLQKINESVGNLYSNFELVKGAADFTNLIRDLGLTKEEIFKLQGAIVQLAIVNGRSLDDVQRTVALALSSGYTEGLQRLGVSINRVTIAEEANKLGFEGGYTALTEQQRSMATYSLLLRKTARYADDLSEAQNRLFGQLKNIEAQTTDISVSIGEKMASCSIETESGDFILSETSKFQSDTYIC